jgi:hypothetical protein
MGTFFPLLVGLQGRFSLMHGTLESRAKENGCQSFDQNKTIFFCFGQRFSFLDRMNRRVILGLE